MVYWMKGAKTSSSQEIVWRSKMRPASANAFRSQVHAIQTWFTEWNECERTIALYSLLRQMTPIHARFLSVVMEHTFRDQAYRTQMYENQANDKDFLIRLSSKSRDEAVKQLLVHLPLLQPGNHAARKEYLNILPDVLSYSHNQGVHEDECRQLLSLALVHPAFPADERTRLQHWLEVLNEESVDGFYDSKINDFPQRENVNRRLESWQKHRQLEKKDSGIGSFEYHSGSFIPPGLPPPGLPPTPHQNATSAHPKVFKTHSLNSAVSIQHDRATVSNGSEDVLGDGSEIINRTGRSLSFPVDPQKLNKIPLSPQSSFESETDDGNNAAKISNYPENPNPGMKDYILWLKSLRLHKYYSLFSKITYDDMFNLAEKELESKNVTKGAMTKILLSISKLNERSQKLTNLEKDVPDEGKLPSVLESLKGILQTPIKPFVPVDNQNLAEGHSPSSTPHPDDLPSQLTKVIGKACTQLLVSKPNEENFAVYISLLEKALNKEAFTAQQKKRLQSWKQQCHMSAKRFNLRRGSQDRGRSLPFHAGDSSTIGGSVKRQRGSQRGLNKLGGTNNSHSGGVPGPMRSNTTDGYYKPRAPLRHHALVSRTKSAPVPASKQKQPMLGLVHQASIESVEGINNSLESLCLSMTEHALADNTDST
ncbi:protein Smaug homolog 1-like isoform X2 [Dendronephthya gigantea]|uniref:protein Smaug homolog 1-like isoform X2 n=1 Tax=Dendronephthya gigantea TaxID=151771 RepID=UPI00106B711A|nr:protein Smaug homolog 1-like isoform X2 [Dendronephthya gigantea]